MNIDLVCDIIVRPMYTSAYTVFSNDKNLTKRLESIKEIVLHRLSMNLN